MTYDHIRVTPISGAIGAEIEGVDLAGDIDGEIFAEIRRAWLDHLVIFFRDQSLDDDALMAFGRRFAPLFRHPNFVPDSIEPDIVRINRQPGDHKIVGQDWHADTTCMAEPPSGAVLFAVDVPPYGGDTIFANQYLAYEALSEGLKAQLRNMTAVHSDILAAGPQANRNKDRSSKVREDAEWRETMSEHPVVRTHPETGRQSLFVNASYTIRFSGMREEESRPLLAYLLEHGRRPEFTGRFQWKKGSVAVWDNRCSLHIAVDDITDHPRIMHRVQMTGDRPLSADATVEAIRAAG